MSIVDILQNIWVILNRNDNIITLLENKRMTHNPINLDMIYKGKGMVIYI